VKKAGTNPSSTRHYFVDETGAGTLFNRKGRVIVGTEGCSRFFILGLADIPAPDVLGRDLNELRAQLLADPSTSSRPPQQNAMACRLQIIFCGRCSVSTNVTRSDMWNCCGRWSAWSTTWMTHARHNTGSIIQRKSR
jgi:hypothetical protein